MAEEHAPRRLAAVVFDLDDTLLDTLAQCVAPAQGEAARAQAALLARWGRPLPTERVLEVRRRHQGQALDVERAVAADLLAEEPDPARRAQLAEVGRRAFFARDPGPLEPFPFAAAVLQEVRLRARCVLLTAGWPATQRLKLARLGLAAAFHETHFVDSLAGEEKRAALAAWLAAGGLAPHEVLVVGDRPGGEIAAALELGCLPLRIRGGEFAAQPTPPGALEAPDVRAVPPLLERPPPRPR